MLNFRCTKTGGKRFLSDFLCRLILDTNYYITKLFFVNAYFDILFHPSVIFCYFSICAVEKEWVFGAIHYKVFNIAVILYIFYPPSFYHCTNGPRLLLL